MESSMKKGLWVAALLGAAFGTGDFASAQVGSRVDNWIVPEQATKAVDLTTPTIFVAATPCRIVDTRGPSGPYGGPILAPNTARDFDLNSSPSCPGISVAAAAYSLNFTVTQAQGPGDLRAWPASTPPAPLVSTLNYLGNQTVANAAIVPAGNFGAISVVAAVSGTHLIIDINGYFTSRPNPGNILAFAVEAPASPALSVLNTEVTHAASNAIFGETSSTGALSFGVFGYHNNGGFDTGGVLGVQGPTFSLPFYGPSGVRAHSRDSFGVLGVGESNLAIGIKGSNVNSAGSETTYGGLACGDTTAVCGIGTLSIAGTKSFVEPHPTAASKVIKFVSLEGNEAGTYFRGRGKFERGLARIRVPEEFRLVTNSEGLGIQVTPIGEMASVAVVKIGLDEIVVKASRNVEFFYTVNGVRKGYEDFTPIVEEGFFVPRSADYRMPAALSAEAKRKLIANGTYNEDGSVNMETAKRLGWTARWKREAPAQKE